MRNSIALFCLLTTASLSAQGTISGSIQSGGLTRDYLLYVPASYNVNTPSALLFNLHGYTSNNLEQSFYADFRSIADTANFLIVLPNGTLDGQGNRFWNTFIGNSSVNDVGFIRDLLDTLESKYTIDPNRVYSTGMSNGGFLSYSLACELNDRIAAIASVTGSMIQSKLNDCNPQRPVPVMEIHGTADNTVPYNGQAVSTFVAIPTLVNAWVGFNHCNPTPSITQVPNISTTDGCTAERQVYSGGDLGSTVEHYKIIGGGHTWPGSAFVIGVTNQDMVACKEIWRFFKQYKLDQLSATNSPVSIAENWTAYPNPVLDHLVLESKNENMVQGVQVFDALGRLQQTFSPGSGGRIVLETGNWAVGVYWVMIKQEGSLSRVKVVK